MSRLESCVETPARCDRMLDEDFTQKSSKLGRSRGRTHLLMYPGSHRCVAPFQSHSGRVALPTQCRVVTSHPGLPWP